MSAIDASFRRPIRFVAIIDPSNTGDCAMPDGDVWISAFLGDCWFLILFLFALLSSVL